MTSPTPNALRARARRAKTKAAKAAEPPPVVTAPPPRLI